MVATLRLEMDASGMRRGADEATRAIDQVKRSATDLYAPTSRIGTSFDALADRGRVLRQSMQGVSAAMGASSAFQGTIETVRNLRGGLDGVSTALQGSAMGLLHMTRVAEDFRQVRLAAQMDGTAKASSVLFGLIRAHPLMFLAMGISAAATAMSFFTKKTDEQTEAQNRLSQAIRNMQQSQAMLGVRARTGDPTLTGREKIDVRIGPMQEALVALQSGRPLTIEQSRALGLSPGLENLEQRAVWPISARQSSTPEWQWQLTGNVKAEWARQQLEQQLLGLYAQRENQAAIESRTRSTGGGGLPVYGPPTPGRIAEEAVAPERYPGYGPPTVEQQAAIQRMQLEELRQQMQELYSTGYDVGYAISSGFMEAARTGQNLRGVLRGIAEDLTRIAQQWASRQIANWMGNAFAGMAGKGTTAIQAAEDTGSFGSFNNNAS